MEWTADDIRRLEMEGNVKVLEDSAPPRTIKLDDSAEEDVEKLYQEYKDGRNKSDPSESDIQAAYVQWVRYWRQFDEELAMGFAVPNGGKRHMTTAKTMKKEGQEPGVPDYFHLKRTEKHIGLVIEFKRLYNKPSDHQVEWLNRLVEEGYEVAVCWTEEVARKITVRHYGLAESRLHYP